MTSPAVTLSTVVLLLIASCGLVTAEESLATCTETREAFTARTAHPVSVTPEVPIAGKLHWKYGEVWEVVLSFCRVGWSL